MIIEDHSHGYKFKKVKTEVKTSTPIDHNYHEEPSERLKAWEAARPEAYHVYRRMWHDGPAKKLLYLYPTHLDIEATSACNLRCTMCPRTEMVNAGTFWESRSFDYDKYCELVDEVAPYTKSIKFNILGEPLLNKQLPDMIRYAKDKGIVDVMLNTNASVLTESLSASLIEAGLDKLFFSFDSPYPEEYDKIRVNSSFRKVLGNIKAFHETRERMGSINPLTRVSMVRMDSDPQRWEDFKTLFTPIVDVVAWVDYVEHSNADAPGILNTETPFCCPQLWQRMFIHPDGVVTPCCVDSARTMVMGNVNEQTITQIWHGDKYNKMRQRHVSGQMGAYPTCRKCHLARLKKNKS